MTYEVPFVPKENITVLSIGNSLEAVTIRALLESFNYRVTTHWIGSRKELLKILTGEIKTDQTIILSCHGVEDGIVIPDEPVLGAGEIANTAKLNDKFIVNLGCLTGSAEIVNAFRESGVKTYIAPVDYPSGSAAIGFISNLFMLLANGTAAEESTSRAAAFDAETKQFRLFV